MNTLHKLGVTDLDCFLFPVLIVAIVAIFAYEG